MRAVKRMGVIPSGSLLTVTTGEYSDYSVSGVFRALADIDCDSLRDTWIEEFPEQKEPYRFERMAFLAMAVRLKLLEPIDCFEWHLGDYSNIDEMSLSKM